MHISEVSNKSILAALIITLMGLGHTANAAVVLLSEFRSVSANASINTPEGSDSASTSRNSLGDFADFDESVEIDLSLENASANGTAQQSSQISTTSITASGAATASAEITAIDPFFSTFADANGNTNLSVDFQVDTPQLFDLSGVVASSVFSGFSSGQADVSLRSQDGSVNISFSTPFFDGNTTPFDLSGTLFPNIYTLSANANIGANAFGEEAVSGAADFSFDFNVAAVPIPPAAWLFGSGLLGLVGIARGKKAA
jgi:hypothetical protein